MGYQSRSRNFSFMGVDSLRRTVEVVPAQEDSPAMLKPPDAVERAIEGTVRRDLATFVQERRRRRIGFLTSSGQWL